jgi:predicted nucleotidyltransferase
MSIEKEIQCRLDAIEADHRVRILYACESGSRAWGFASSNSDWDVRFIYDHDLPWYLSISHKRDVIELPIEGDLDINGWDLRKALYLLGKSNPVLNEWLGSPIVYRADREFVAGMCVLAERFLNPVALFHHYQHMACGNFREYLKGETVRVKKYLYVLRPILACLWIERGLGIPPVLFDELVAGVVSEGELFAEIEALLVRKKAGDELQSGPRLPVIHAFIEQELERLRNVAIEKAEPVDWSELDRFFQSRLGVS